MTYINVNKFKNWMDDHCKLPYDLNAVLNELDTQHSNTGCNCYELSGYETKSGNPETYDYEYEYEIDEDGNIINGTYIF